MAYKVMVNVPARSIYGDDLEGEYDGVVYKDYYQASIVRDEAQNWREDVDAWIVEVEE